MQDIYSTIKDQYGVDPKEGLNPNSFQQVLIAEAELGEITPETLNNSISSLESQIVSEQDPKMQKELQKKLENLKKVAERPKKEISMDLENKWSKNFGEVDKLIGTLDARSKSQLLTNVFINENPKWHPERNSFVHIKIVCSRGVDTKDDDLMKSALFHDIAKFDTATFNAQGWPTCLGHDKKGSESAKGAGMNDTVVYVCANHMKVKGWQGDSEGGTLNPSTKFQIFSEAPGQTPDEKAKAFYKLCVFSKMDNMAYDFDSAKLAWPNPTYEKWDEECPLKDEFKKAELVEIKVEKAKPTFTSQELMAFGAKGPQIGEINKAIVGKTKEEAFEIIKQILGNPELKMESKRWVMTFESFKKNKHAKLLENVSEFSEVRLMFPGDKYTAITDMKIQDGKIVGEDIEGVVNSYDDTALSTCFDKFKKAGLSVLNKTNSFSQEDADIVYSGWEVRDGEDIEGFYTIKLDPLNKAIESGKIELVKDEDGDYEVIVK
jgi:hypothetical protein